MAPNGYYLGLRIRFAFPAEEVNALPKGWIDLYSRSKFFFGDPSLRWSFDNIGAIRWSALWRDDPQSMIARSAVFGMRYGAVASFSDPSGARSYALLFRPEREYSDSELERIARLVATLHQDAAPPTTLTRAEIEVLRAIKEGSRLKQVAHDLGVTEGAIKQRLKNARVKLGASTGTQAATKARDFGLI